MDGDVRSSSSDASNDSTNSTALNSGSGDHLNKPKKLANQSDN